MGWVHACSESCPARGHGAAHSIWVRGPSLWPLRIPVGDCALQVCHLVLDERCQFLPGEGVLPVPCCFRDDEEPGEDVVEEEVRGW